MGLRAGTLNHLAVLERKVTAPDGRGGQTPEWVAVGEVWIGIRPLNAFQRAKLGGTESGVTHQVTMRYRAGVDATFRLRLGERVFAPAGPPVDMDERHETLEWSCTEFKEPSHGG